MCFTLKSVMSVTLTVAYKESLMVQPVVTAMS